MYVKHHSKALYIHPRVQTNATSYILYLRSSLIGRKVANTIGYEVQLIFLHK